MSNIKLKFVMFFLIIFLVSWNVSASSEEELTIFSVFVNSSQSEITINGMEFGDNIDGLKVSLAGVDLFIHTLNYLE